MSCNTRNSEYISGPAIDTQPDQRIFRNRTMIPHFDSNSVRIQVLRSAESRTKTRQKRCQYLEALSEGTRTKKARNVRDISYKEQDNPIVLLSSGRFGRGSMRRQAMLKGTSISRVCSPWSSTLRALVKSQWI